MAVPFIDFAQALSSATNKRHLLLGNGFSIALRPDIFSYQSLYEKADFSKVPYAKNLFEAIGTSDFEAIIRAIVNAARLLKVYSGASPALIQQLEKDAAALKN